MSHTDSSEAPLMLGVSGLRGIVGKSLTPEVAARFGGAVGGWLNERAGYRARVCVGRDGRAGGETLSRATIEALALSGCDVSDLGVSATPTVGFVVGEYAFDAGMVVTASHNPQEWNGLKCIVAEPAPEPRARGRGASAPSALVVNEIIARFRTSNAQPARDSGRIEILSNGTTASHVGHMMMGIYPLEGQDQPHQIAARGFKVALDSVNASGAAGGRELLVDHLACRLVHLNADSSGVFPHPPEPLRENLVDLCTAVRDSGADIGFAQDPDADRLAVVDERGGYIGEEYTLVLAAEALLGGLKARPPKGKQKGDLVLVTNLSTSRMLDDVAARHGARVVRTAVGEANVVEAMKREKAAGHRVVLGGEGNGGVIWPEVTYVRDSLSAMALVLSLMARPGKSVSELVAEMPAYAIEKRKVEIARREHARPAVEKIAAAYQDQRIDLQDGVRVDWVDRRAWLHVRASNTEPIMRLIAEAPTAPEVKSILDDAAGVISG